MKGDEKVIEFLNKALTNELTAINQYWLHYRVLKDWGVHKLADYERHESIDEMKHADVLAERGRYEAAATVSLGAARYHEMQARSSSGQVAIDAADAALRQHPDDFWFGELAAQVRAPDPATAADAIDRFDELIARWPNHGPFHNGRGVALATLGRGPEAHAAFEQATVLSPLSPEAWENQARMFLAEGSPQEARRVLDQGIARAVRTERLVELRNSLG